MSHPTQYNKRVWDGRDMLDFGNPAQWDIGDYNHFTKAMHNGGLQMNSTGLVDTTGKEIFQGDIVRWDDCSSGKKCEYWRVAHVVYEPGCYIFRTIPALCVNCMKDYSNDFKCGSFIYSPDTASGGNIMEVIGNEHENPELLDPVATTK